MELLVHGPRGNLSEWFCPFTDAFISKLQAEGIGTDRYPVKRVNESNYEVIDLCDREVAVNINNMFIVNPKTGNYVLFTSFFDLRQFVGSGEIPQKNLLKVFSGHYDKQIISRDCKAIEDKFSPWYFRPWKDYSFYDYQWSPKNQNLFFRGLHIPKVRETIKHIRSKQQKDLDVSVEPSDRLEFSMYHHAAIDALVNLSVSGIRDMCHRDIELWKMGCPFIKPRFTSELLVDIPDDVYFPVDWEVDRNFITPIPIDSKKLAKDIIEKFNEVKNNMSLLKKTSNLGKKFWKDNFTLNKIVDNSFELLISTGIL